ncbi:hypothetical protein [Methanobrevibacter sp.]|uniref:hypothetical protein n=1 Tax=Methanobrevibacter sp. TaxID=66852 RepID=UPI003868D18D
MNPEEDHSWSYCKWCKTPFKRTHNHMKYCSDECRCNALREQKAKYQAKRRLLAKKGVLVLPEYKKYGLGSYGTSSMSHRKSDFTKEYESIQKELEHLRLKKRKQSGEK